MKSIVQNSDKEYDDLDEIIRTHIKYHGNCLVCGEYENRNYSWPCFPYRLAIRAKAAETSTDTTGHKVWVVLFDDLEYGVLLSIHGTREKAEAALLKLKQKDLEKELQKLEIENRWNQKRNFLKFVASFCGQNPFPNPTIETVSCQCYVEEIEVQ